jgi:hypothetical protein
MSRLEVNLFFNTVHDVEEGHQAVQIVEVAEFGLGCPTQKITEAQEACEVCLATVL